MAAPSNRSGAGKLPPARSPGQRQNQLINMAMDYAEEQFATGKATSQLATHFLKLATVREQKELRKLDIEAELRLAQTKAAGTTEEIVHITRAALTAFGGYAGLEPEDEPQEF